MSHSGALKELLGKYYSQGAKGIGSDPRKHQNARRKLKTDARSGRAYFFGDNGEKTEYVSFGMDRSTDLGTYRRMVASGIDLQPTDADYYRLHADLLNEADVKDLNRNNRKDHY